MTRSSKAAQLYQLIQAMSRGEKKVFTKMVGKGNEPTYMPIFRYLNKKEVFSDEDFFKRFSTEKSKLPGLQNYLFKLLVDSLRGDQDQPLILNNAKVADIQILYSKGIWSALPMAFKAAKAETLASEDFEIYIQVLHLELRYLMNIRRDGSEDRCAEIFGEIEDTIALLNNESKYAKFHHQHFFRKNEGFHRLTNAAREQLLALADHELLQESSTAMSKRALSYYWRCKCEVAHAQDNKEELYSCCKAWLDLYRDNPVFRDAQRKLFIASLNNMMFVCNITQKYTELEKLFVYVDSLEIDDKLSRISLFQHTFSNKLAYYNEVKKDLKKLEALLEEAKDFFKNHKRVISKESRLIYYSNFVVFNRILKNDEDAYDFCLQARSEGFKGDRKDVMVLINLHYLIFLFERGPSKNFLKVVESTRQTLKYRKLKTKTEAFLLDFFSKASEKGLDEEEMSELLRKLDQKTAPLEQVPGETWMYDCLLLKDWIREQLERYK